MHQHYTIERRPFRPSVIYYNGVAVGESREVFFEPPQDPAEVVGTVLAQAKGIWWSPMREISVASWGRDGGPLIADADGEHAFPPPSDVSARFQHNVLVSNTFALHPMFGVGHIVRTNGTIAAFWCGGGSCHVVEVENLTKLAAVLDRLCLDEYGGLTKEAPRSGADKNKIPHAKALSKTVSDALEALLS